MQETWKRFVYPLIEDKKQDVEEDTYHRHIENQLMLLGWEPWKGEIIHKQSLRIGNRNRMEPDILVARDDEYQFVIEVKRPGNTQAKEEITQLESYMRQLRLDVGIYIGEHIEMFYDKPNTNHVVSVFKWAIDLEEKRGARFVELFSKENFSKDAIVDFCKERIQEIQRQNSLNEIKSSLIADAQTQIAESLKPYLMEKYGGSFSEEEIKGMLATIRFTASADGSLPEPKVVIPQPQPTHKSNIINCLLTRNTEVQDGKIIVKEDVHFDTPSGAAQFCVGGSANGWKEWKDEKGHELNEYRTNDGTHNSVARFDENRVTDPRQFQLDFWTKFKNKLEATGKIPTLQTPQPHNWYDVRIGRSNILLNNVCNTQKNFVGVKLYIRKPAVDKYFPVLLGRMNEINTALGCEPEWDANPAAQDKTIAQFHKTDLSDPQKVEEALDWLVQQTIIFYNVFSKEVKGI